MQSTLLGQLIEHADVGALASDSGRYIAANTYACTLTGYERGELIGRPVDELCRRSGSGVISLSRKDGAAIEVGYRVVNATLAGIPVVLSLFWPL